MTNDEIVIGFDTEKDDSLKIDLKRIEGVVNGLILVLTGYIDTYNSNSFQKRVQKAIDASFLNLAFDCRALNYVSSTGIGSFTTFLKTLKASNGSLVLFEVQPKVLEVFQLLGFSSFFNIKDSQEAAENFFKNGSSSISNGAFPQIFDCPICAKKLKASKSGRFRCSGCKTILAVDETGRVFLG
ncbi:MAG: STAS domain-containing protein [Spirochaetaceae bacterium]|jgi:anti-anti-sigma factor|nr:STAS domain-containing protein [Spirochaetaceae bacterium]